MLLPRVFVGSSSEGLAVVDAVHRLLQQALSGTADVRPWPGEFRLTRAYIEALEHLLDASDFAVLVLTPDDRTTSRDTERLSPRDNVVFELGLFFGRLGRERCFFIQRRDLDLKLPSDLLGIEPASYSLAPGETLATALTPACARIAQAIREATATLPSRARLDDVTRADQAALRRLGDRVVGTWWERILASGEAPALSFFRIEPDEVHSAVRLVNGKAYSSEGEHVANWRSAAVRLENERIIYIRECQRLDAAPEAGREARPTVTPWLPGLGEVNFDADEGVIDQGSGRFWESEEAHPERTVIKFAEVRRTLDESHAATMRAGSESARRALVQAILRGW
jgi:hypothetical protein